MLRYAHFFSLKGRCNYNKSACSFGGGLGVFLFIDENLNYSLEVLELTVTSTIWVVVDHLISPRFKKTRNRLSSSRLSPTMTTELPL